MSFATTNRVQLAIPLKHPEDTYTFTYNPNFPGPLTIDIISSKHRPYMLVENDDETSHDATVVKTHDTTPVKNPLIALNKGKKRA